MPDRAFYCSPYSSLQQLVARPLLVLPWKVRSGPRCWLHVAAHVLKPMDDICGRHSVWRC